MTLGRETVGQIYLALGISLALAFFATVDMPSTTEAALRPGGTSGRRAVGARTYVGIFPKIYEPGVDAAYYQHPRQFRLTDADSVLLFARLHWRRWGSQHASARGWAKTCGEGGLEGYGCHSGRVRLMAGDIASCHTTGHQFYGSLTAFGPTVYGGSFEISVTSMAQNCGAPRPARDSSDASGRTKVRPPELTATPRAPLVSDRQSYLACDNRNKPDYPSLRSAPRACALGLGASEYDSSPVPGHPTPQAVRLRGLRWRHWGDFRATARGRVCSAYGASCERARVTVVSPRSILPAGGKTIYQRIKVRHLPTTGLVGAYTDWYEPGLDY
jgi:hypothetical protein